MSTDLSLLPIGVMSKGIAEIPGIEAWLGDQVVRARFGRFWQPISAVAGWGHKSTAQQAMQYVTNKARNMSVAARPWCSDAVLNAAVATVQACDVVIHLNPTNVLRFLARDTQYRNHYEIGGGSGEVGGRYALENR